MITPILIGIVVFVVIAAFLAESSARAAGCSLWTVFSCGGTL